MRGVQPNNSRWLGFFCSGFLAAVACAFGPASADPPGPASRSGEAHARITSRLYTLSRLGPEHVANAVYRRGADGNSYIVTWGDRLLQWPLEESGAMQEVYPKEGDWQENQWAGMIKPKVQDMDGDGVAEIVVTEAEIPEARLAIFKRGTDPTKLWKTHRLDKGLYAPHSLEVTDADEDGDYDIIAGEMTAGGWSFPLHENPTLWIYVNQGGLNFRKYPLAQGEGVHEMKLAPVKIGGRQVLCAADEIQIWKFPKMDTHVGFWLIVPPR